MTRPLYDRSGADERLPEGGHAGLWWDKLFNGYGADWQVPEDGKAQWIESVSGERGNRAYLQEFAERQIALGRRLTAQARVLRTDWHFTTGLGLSHPVENGFTWHPTLGVPYLPASSVKGLLRAWVEVWQEFSTEAERNTLIQQWFGSQEQAGSLLFLDAVPVEPVILSPDVMTPHMGKWYEKGNEMTTLAPSADRVPADWHSPVPVVFLVVKKAAFLFQVAPRRPSTQNEVTQAMQWLQCALELLGAGAKTAAGYGRMSEDSPVLERLLQAQRKLDEQAAVAERQKQLSPLDRSIQEALAEKRKADPGMADSVALLQVIERWQGEDRIAVARRIKSLMEANGTWKPKSSKPAKDKDHKRTLQVQEILKEV